MTQGTAAHRAPAEHDEVSHMSTTLEHAQQTRGASAVLHGIHPLRGYPVTWHLTPLTALVPGGRGAMFLVERADGHIDDALVWELAEKETVVMTTTEMCDVVRRSAGPTGAARVR